MARAREGQGGTIDVPPPVPVERLRRAWDDVPELACADAWQQACRAWRDDANDTRLRVATRKALWLDDTQLDDWLKRRLDTNAIIRAHGHVTATSAGVEADLSRRRLETGALRTHPVWTEHRDGTRRMFFPAEEVPRAIVRACADLERLPDHPFIRAAWVSQTFGVVHPFRDANGGTARFLASLELVRAALPPFVFSSELRNGAYIEALALRDNLDSLARVVYEAVQQMLAGALLDGRAPVATWDDASRARADRWSTTANDAVRAGVGDGAERVEGALTRIARTGVRIAVVPEPVVASWSIASPVPAHVDLAFFALRGGPMHWLGAVVVGRAGHELGSTIERQHVATYFVAPANEPDAIADARFRRWLDTRIAQIMRGLARWM